MKKNEKNTSAIEWIDILNTKEDKPTNIRKSLVSFGLKGAAFLGDRKLSEDFNKLKDLKEPENLKIMIKILNEMIKLLGNMIEDAPRCANYEIRQAEKSKDEAKKDRDKAEANLKEAKDKVEEAKDNLKEAEDRVKAFEEMVGVWKKSLDKAEESLKIKTNTLKNAKCIEDVLKPLGKIKTMFQEHLKNCQKPKK